MKARIIETGKVVDVYWKLANAIAYVGDYGIVFVPNGKWETIEETTT